MSACVSGIRRSTSLLAVVAAATTAMAPETPVLVNVTMSPSYMEPVLLVQFNPALAALIMATIICFFVVGLATGYLRKCIRPAEADPEDGVGLRGASRTGGTRSKSRRGLDPGILEALPRVQYKDLPADEQVRQYVDCPVCLAAFDANDSLRLLPVCSHAFHSDCIDAWFQSHSTCPLCRACLALPADNASREDRRGDAGDGEQGGMVRVSEGLDVIEVVIGGDAEQDSSRSAAFSESLQDRTGGTPIANSSTVEEKERVTAQLFLRNTAVGSFKPEVRVVIAPEKAAALASIRRSNSAGTDLQVLHPRYVVDSEGTQHNRNDQTHAIDVEEFHLKDHDGDQAQPSESSSRHPVSLAQRWFLGGMETGASGVTQQISRFGPQLVQSTRWSSPNLRQLENPESSER